MKQIEIKEVSQSDVKRLQQVSRQTFIETFSTRNTEENMNKYLEEGLTEEKLSSELANTGSQFYFAEMDGKVIGYLKLNFGQSQTELQDEKAIEIERIYVLKEFLGKKVGQLLYDKVIDIARLQRAHYVWLGVWEENLRAITFYKKNGFVEFGKHLFKLGNDEQTDLMMKLQLKDY